MKKLFLDKRILVIFLIGDYLSNNQLYLLLLFKVEQEKV